MTTQDVAGTICICELIAYFAERKGAVFAAPFPVAS